MIYELLIRNFEVALKSDCTDDSRYGLFDYYEQGRIVDQKV